MKHPMERFLMKLIILGKISAIEFHRQMGRYYGYPWCCINNYIRVLYAGHPPAKYMHDVHGHRHPINMVLCNDCNDIYNRFVGINYSPKNFV
jgi:hypothetical protein